jgi:phospholipase/lecithinase/hemolysin
MEVVEVGCCGTGTFEMSYLCDPHSSFTCTNANKYVFWDAFHPSEKTSQIISNHLFGKIMEKFL